MGCRRPGRHVAKIGVAPPKIRTFISGVTLTVKPRWGTMAMLAAIVVEGMSMLPFGHPPIHMPNTQAKKPAARFL